MSKKTMQKIFRIYDQAERHLAKQSIEVDETHLRNTFASIYSPGPSYQFIFDFPTRSFDYVSKETDRILGVQSDKFDPEQLFSLIHPQDIDHFQKCEELAGYFLLEHIPRELLPYYKVSYQFRHQVKTGEYPLFLRQSITLSTDESGNMSKTMSNHSDISHITHLNNKKVSFIDIRGINSYFNISSVRDLNSPPENKLSFSSREMEVIKLISEGFSSKEISTQLYISFDTVRTHRKNILSKTGLKNMTQVVSYSIKEGLI